MGPGGRYSDLGQSRGGRSLLRKRGGRWREASEFLTSLPLNVLDEAVPLPESGGFWCLFAMPLGPVRWKQPKGIKGPIAVRALVCSLRAASRLRLCPLCLKARRICSSGFQLL